VASEIANFESKLKKLRPVLVEGVTKEFTRMTHHIYCTGLRDDLSSLNAQGHSTVS
jgi:hypothetical protein